MKKLVPVALIGAVTLGLIALEGHHHLKYGHFFPLGSMDDNFDMRQWHENDGFVGTLSKSFSFQDELRTEPILGRPLSIMRRPFVARTLWRLHKPSS